MRVERALRAAAAVTVASAAIALLGGVGAGARADGWWTPP
ncbi:MAG: hypothetical protein JWN10_1478, partial [Solirubrobacterales bacterium]|nr:hypothetical protein [Solirubrobacterales bacterium]